MEEKLLAIKIMMMMKLSLLFLLRLVAKFLTLLMTLPFVLMLMVFTVLEAEVRWLLALSRLVRASKKH